MRLIDRLTIIGGIGVVSAAVGFGAYDFLRTCEEATLEQQIIYAIFSREKEPSISHEKILKAMDDFNRRYSLHIYKDNPDISTDLTNSYSDTTDSSDSSDSTGSTDSTGSINSYLDSK